MWQAFPASEGDQLLFPCISQMVAFSLKLDSTTRMSTRQPIPAFYDSTQFHRVLSLYLREIDAFTGSTDQGGLNEIRGLRALVASPIDRPRTSA